MSRARRQRVIEQSLQPPELDLNGLLMEDENVIRQKQQEYAGQMGRWPSL